MQAAFILKSSFKCFPSGTAHLCMVNSDDVRSKQMLAFSYDEHYFIVPDNGIISLLTNTIPSNVYAFHYEMQGGFSSLNAIASAVGAIHNGTIQDAEPTTRYETRPQTRAITKGNMIEGFVIYIDSYGNVITNISKELFERVRKGRLCKIHIQSVRDEVEYLAKSFSEAENGDLIALFNSLNLLEIALYNDQIATRYNLELDSSIIVEFFDNNLTLT